MIKDHFHFKTKDGIIFTTRGYKHPPGFVRAVALYKPEGKILKKNIDELGIEWIKNEKPEYLRDFGLGQAIYVKEEDITEIFDPFKDNLKIIERIKEEYIKKLIGELNSVGIDLKDIGFIGSYLVNTGNEPNDVDILIRGKENMKKVKENFKTILINLGAKNTPEPEYMFQSIERYNKKYNSEYNQFGKIILNRWPTINIPGKLFCKLRFTLKEDEIFDIVPGMDIMDTIIEGEVLDDEEISFMPRLFKIKTEEGIFQVLTYFWDFSYCVSKGDKVKIKAIKTDKNFLIIKNPKEHGITFLNKIEVSELYNNFDTIYETEIKPYIESNVPRNELTEPVYYILDNFKLRRFRAAFPILIANAYKKNKDIILPIAAASELIFSIALVQDDIIDGDERRGEIMASHMKFGIGRALASCDYTYTFIVKMLSSIQNKISEEIFQEIIRGFFDANERLYKSFIQEKIYANDWNLSLGEILETYKNKTIQGTNALTCAVLACTENLELANLIKQYSYNLAIAGQIKNDIYDATRYLETRGYSDLENGYITYIIRKLMDSERNQEKDEITKFLEKRDHEQIIRILKDKNIISSCIKDCYIFTSVALSYVWDKFPELKDILIAWAEGNVKFSRKI